MKLCYFADLTHTAQGVHAPYFPLGAGLVAAYAKQEIGNEIEVDVFKFPDELEKAVLKRKPDFLCMSFYAWNAELSYAFANSVKEKHPEVITVFGGPNFPLDENARKTFSDRYPLIDFFISGEGELSFVELFLRLRNCSFDVNKLKSSGAIINNCTYSTPTGELIEGPLVRIDDLDRLPCPYTEGLFDKFFDMPLNPLHQTTRGCPFSCTYCTGALRINSKIYRYSFEKIKESLTYIAKHAKKTDNIVLADLNFGMYNQDIQVCELLARLAIEFNYPLLFLSSYGKNNLKNVMKATEILKGIWLQVGASLQSSDLEVLSNIKRKNISASDMMEIAKKAQSYGTPTFTEIILALPGDTTEKHIQSIRAGIDAGIRHIRVYQLILLPGTEISSDASREKFKMTAKYRVLSQCAGIYNFFGNEFRVAEFQEFVYSNSTMSIHDYCHCRFMDVIVEIFINNAWFDEVIELFAVFQLPIFDCLLFLLDNKDVITPQMLSIYESFKSDLLVNLFDTYDQINEFTQTPGVIEKYLSGELGKNELLDHKALAYIHLKDTFDSFYNAAINYLKENNLWSHKAELYLKELKRFCYCMKSDCTSYEDEFVEEFLFDFDFIASQNYRIDPNALDIVKKKYKFYYPDNVKTTIKKSLGIYGTSIAGLGRLIQRTNMKSLNRSFLSI